MTTEEAIEILKGDFSKVTLRENESHADVFSKAFDMAMDALEKQTEYQKRIKSLVNTIEEICKNSRDRHVDDEHCGLCEYDGAYVGESGDWMNECPGFDTDDCFVLSKEFRNKYIDWSEEE